ncbi:MAG TPA: peptidase domain-containing ABC transporter [Herpetosiphonaceae bacterium]
MLFKRMAYQRVPWVRSSDGRDCGAAAFASVAAYYGHHLSLEQAREVVETDLNGTTLQGLRNGGRLVGFDARPARAIYEALAHIQLPAIVHLNDIDGHYVVLAQWTPTAVRIVDPNRGLLTVPRAAFEQQWSGYLVEYRPTPALQARSRDFNPVRVFLSFVQQHRRLIGLALLFAICATGLGWSASWFLQLLIDQIIPSREAQLLLAFGLGLFAISALQGLLHYARLWLVARAGRQIHRAYGQRYLKHLITLPQRVYDTRCPQSMMLRLGHIESIQQATTENFVQLTTDGLMLIGALMVIAFYDLRTALIASLTIPLIVIVLLLLNNRVYTAQRTMLLRMEEMFAYLGNMLDGLRTIKVFSAEAQHQRLGLEKLDTFIESRYTDRLTTALASVWVSATTALVTAVVLVYSASRVLAAEITPGQMVFIFGMTAFFFAPIQRLPAILINLRISLVGMERLEEILALAPEHTRVSEPSTLTTIEGRIEFDQVTFGYKQQQPVLKQVSFSVQPGETIAIVGETGSGKTSLANLIAGFYLPQEGDVRIDGVSTRRIVPDELRRMISAVFQNSRLFPHSVRENITMLQDAPVDSVYRAAEIANAAPFIQQLVRGYDTQVSRTGENFSSGQAQRIALARALFKDAPILILDEATSNLDSATEQGIIQALTDHRQGRTTIIIAHRLSTIINADRIFVMHQGRMVESGTHHDLMDRRGTYYNLFRWQTHDGSVREPRSLEPGQQEGRITMSQYVQ